jgi:long-chain acyl-CoA synthetase
MGVQVGQILRQAARFSPDAIAVVDLGHEGDARREFSFAELERMARCVAAQLMAAGVRPGDRVALLAENQAEVAAAWFGVVYAGAAVVPLHVLSTASELAQRLGHAGVALLIHDRARGPLVSEVLAAHGGGVQALSLDAIDWQQRAVAYPVDTSPGDTAMVLYTSATTGQAKGAAISHASLLLHTALLVQHALELDQSSRVLCTLPLSHSYGCRLTLLAPFYARARIVVLPRFNAERTLRAIRDEGLTWLAAVPTMFAAWAQIELAGGDIPGRRAELAAGQVPRTLRWALSAGAPLAASVAERAEARLGACVREGYGMTEATFATINAPPDERVVGSVGKPVWGVELRVVDEAGADVPAGERGEVLVRGHNVMTQYLFDDASTAAAARDGWVHSGDVGRVDAQGRLYIVDRIKDMIIRGGYNVYPSELESVLAAHPDVRSVCVLGRPDAFYGEEIVAVVVAGRAELGVADLHDFAAHRVSRTRLPREYAFVDELPLGASGKVLKRTLREWLAAGRITAEKAP